MKFVNGIKTFVRDEEGQDLIEYALLAGLISIVCVLAIQAAGTKVSTLFNNCLLYTSPSPRDISGSRMPSSA